MVEQGRSPSPEFDKPIQQWEVTAIPDTVEQWYASGAEAGEVPVAKPVMHLPSVAEEQEQQVLQAELPVIARGEVSDIAHAAAERLGGSTSQPTEEATTTEPTHEETIRALRIEEAIIKNNPELAMALRLEENLSPLRQEGYHLLPHEAPDWLQRRDALWMSRALIYTAQKAQENDKPLTSDEVNDYFGKFVRRQLPEQQRDARQRAAGVPEPAPPDITLEHVFAAVQRHLLLYYKLSGQREDMQPYYQASVMVHELLEKMVSVSEDTQTPPQDTIS